MLSFYDPHGKVIPVAPDGVTFRPAAYGILLENDEVLLTQQPHTDLWRPPGAILNRHETPIQSIKQQFRRILGVTPDVGPLVFVEDQYRYDGEGEAWHLSVLYYMVGRPKMTLTTADPQGVEWVPLFSLERQDVQYGYEALQAASLFAQTDGLKGA